MTTTDERSPALPIACDLTAIPGDERDAHMVRTRMLFSEACQERRELQGGYAWRFDAGRFDELAAYVANERRCCPFFSFTIEVTPAGGPVWLRLTGDATVKAYLRSELAADQAARR